MDKLQIIRRKNRLRVIFSLLTFGLYFSFVLNWTDFGAPMLEGIGGTLINGALLMFVSLIVIFILLEVIYLRLARNADGEDK